MKKFSTILLIVLITILNAFSEEAIDVNRPTPDPEEKVDQPDDTEEAESERTLSKLRVEGRYFKNEEDEIVNLHGFAQTYSPFFNQNKWGNHDVSGCLTYNKTMINRIMAAGWEMSFVRMHLDPYWSDDHSKPSVRYEGHERFSQARFKKYLDEVFIPMAEHAILKGLYVVFRPPGVSPERIAVGDNYNLFLEEVWDIVSSHPKIKNNSAIMFELANEPIDILGSNGTYSSTGQGHFDNLKIFFQTIVNKIRTNSSNIILIPGLAYQSSYSGFANNPIEGSNIGYAVHVYPGWYGSDTEEASVELGGSMGGGYESFQRGWDAQVKPVADFAPIIVTEMDWAPKKYNASWGKSFTGETGGPGFGANFKYIADNTGNVSWLIFTECHHLAEFKNKEGVPGSYTFLNDPEACPWPTYHWYKEYFLGDSEVSKTVDRIEIVGIDNEINILTGGDLYLVAKAIYKGGSSKLITLNTIFTASDPSLINIKSNGRIIALKNGSSTIEATYRLSDSVIKRFSFDVHASTFPLTKDVFNSSIYAEGTFDEETHTLVTGQWGFGGWWYNNGADLTDYRYLIAELGNDNASSVSLRLFDENDYWAQPTIYDFGNTRRVVVELDKMYKEIDGIQVKLNPAQIYIVGFWSSGGKPIVIKDIRLANNLD